MSQQGKTEVEFIVQGLHHEDHDDGTIEDIAAHLHRYLTEAGYDIEGVATNRREIDTPMAKVSSESLATLASAARWANANRETGSHTESLPGRDSLEEALEDVAVWGTEANTVSGYDEETVLKMIAMVGGRVHLLWQLTADGICNYGIELQLEEIDEATLEEAAEAFVNSVDLARPDEKFVEWAEDKAGERADEIMETVDSFEEVGINLHVAKDGLAFVSFDADSLYPETLDLPPGVDYGTVEEYIEHRRVLNQDWAGEVVDILPHEGVRGRLGYDPVPIGTMTVGDRRIWAIDIENPLQSEGETSSR